jgi:hypothetical protein
MNSLAAQAFIFFLGGFETSSSTMTFCLYELSLHQDIQDRLREEIDVVLQKYDGRLTYEGIQEMGYLDKVVSGKKHSCNYVHIFQKTGHIDLHNANITITTVITSVNFALLYWVVRRIKNFCVFRIFSLVHSLFTGDTILSRKYSPSIHPRLRI